MPAGAERSVHVYATRPGGQEVDGLAEQNGNMFQLRIVDCGLRLGIHAQPSASHSAIRNPQSAFLHSPKGRFVAGFVMPKLLAACCAVSKTWNWSSTPVVRKIFLI